MATVFIPGSFIREWSKNPDTLKREVWRYLEDSGFIHDAKGSFGRLFSMRDTLRRDGLLVKQMVNM